MSGSGTDHGKARIQAGGGLLGLDLDGTVLLPGEELVPGILEEVLLWRALGWRVAVITARYHVPRAVQELGVDAYTRSYGALVYAQGQEIHRQVMPADVVGAALAFAPEGSRLMVLSAGEVFTRQPRRPGDRPLHDWPHGQDFVKVLLEHPDVKAVQHAARSWEALPGVTVIWERPTACMLVAAGADKGSALKRLAGHYGLPLSRTVAAGDGFSDAAMMHAAGQFLVVGRNPVLNRGSAFAETTRDVPPELALLRRAWHAGKEERVRGTKGLRV